MSSTAIISNSYREIVRLVVKANAYIRNLITENIRSNDIHTDSITIGQGDCRITIDPECGGDVAYQPVEGDVLVVLPGGNVGFTQNLTSIGVELDNLGEYSETLTENFEDLRARVECLEEFILDHFGTVLYTPAP